MDNHFLPPPSGIVKESLGVLSTGQEEIALLKKIGKKVIRSPIWEVSRFEEGKVVTVKLSYYLSRYGTDIPHVDSQFSVFRKVAVNNIVPAGPGNKRSHFKQYG